MSPKDFTSMLNQINAKASGLANQANRIYRKLHPDDQIKTDVYSASDFVQDGKISIPEDAQKLFDHAETTKQATESVVENSGKDAEPVEKDPPSEPVKEMSAEELQQQFKESQKGKPQEEKTEKLVVKENPVLNSLKRAFGIKPISERTIEKKINDVRFTFEFPTSLSVDFSFAVAQSEGIGTFDFAKSLEIAQVAFSVVAMNGVPVNDCFGIAEGKYPVGYLLPRFRKLCCVKMMDLFQSMKDDELEKILSFYSDNVGYAEDAFGNSSDFIQMRCPVCGKTKVVSASEEKVPVRYCEFDGEKMEAVSSASSDVDSPLA